MDMEKSGKTLVWIELISVQNATEGCSQWCKSAMGICFVLRAAGHCSLSTVFSLYINDIMVGIEFEIRLFANDCVCYRQIDSIEDISKLEKDIDQLGKWARKCGMRFRAM